MFVRIIILYARTQVQFTIMQASAESLWLVRSGSSLENNMQRIQPINKVCLTMERCWQPLAVLIQLKRRLMRLSSIWVSQQLVCFHRAGHDLCVCAAGFFQKSTLSQQRENIWHAIAVAMDTGTASTLAAWIWRKLFQNCLSTTWVVTAWCRCQSLI